MQPLAHLPVILLDCLLFCRQAIVLEKHEGGEDHGEVEKEDDYIN
ncbi:MAG: hypothetical protein PUD20_07510 [bacterium]|nr:hypothetical protein [bacterium]